MIVRVDEPGEHDAVLVAHHRGVGMAGDELGEGHPLLGEVETEAHWRSVRPAWIAPVGDG